MDCFKQQDNYKSSTAKISKNVLPNNELKLTCFYFIDFFYQFYNRLSTRVFKTIEAWNSVKHQPVCGSLHTSPENKSSLSIYRYVTSQYWGTAAHTLSFSTGAVRFMLKCPPKITIYRNNHVKDTKHHVCRQNSSKLLRGSRKSFTIK